MLNNDSNNNFTVVLKVIPIFTRTYNVKWTKLHFFNI